MRPQVARAYNPQATRELKSLKPMPAKLAKLISIFPDYILGIFTTTIEGKMKILIEQGADPDVQTNMNILPIQYAIGQDNIDLLDYLLQRGVDPNTRYSNSVSILMHAAWQGCPKAVETLLACGADPTYQNLAGLTALAYADRFNNPYIKQLLLCEKQKIA